MKQSHVCKNQASTCSAVTLNTFNLKPPLKDAEYANKNKLIYLLPKLKSFTFATLVLEFKKCKVMMKHYIESFIGTHKQKQLLMKVTLIIYFNQSIVLLYQTYKNLQDKVQVSLLIHSLIIKVTFQSITHQLEAVKSNYQKNQTIQENHSLK